ncbi:MAG: glycosyltransferase family 2 protein [Candidatus Bathyarchaeota archaeon]|nr:glycosyltransferase family 2 protein [Candidatus Bathyarchaeota archaeon]
MQTDGPLLSVVVPMYNEEPTVGNVIRRLKLVLSETGVRHEILVVDDCSLDGSVAAAAKYGVRVLKLKQHLGKGYVLRAGFAKAKGNIIATIDSDGSHLPEELPLLLLPVMQGKADLVIGSRFSTQTSATSSRNQAGNKLFNVLIHFLTGTPISDSQSGYRVMTREVLESMDLLSGEYEIESEMLVKTVKGRFCIREVPITFEQRTYGRSGIDPLMDGFKILVSIISAFLRGR